MSRARTGRRGLGSVTGSFGRIRVRPDGRIKDYRLRLPVDQVETLASLMPMLDDHAAGRVLTATHDNLARLRVVADPLPGYERRAAGQYVRGDAVRVTGSARSCNIACSHVGAELIGARLRLARQEADQWVEFRARVVRHTEDEGPRSLIEIVPDRQLLAIRSDRELGETGNKLAGEVWTHEQFRDWEQAEHD